MDAPKGPGGRVAGLLLAAGGGRRMGRPKALLSTDGVGSWLRHGVRLLLESDCDPVLVVLGAGADDAAKLLGEDPRIVIVRANRWPDGIGESLKAGLTALTAVDGCAADAVLVTLVDLPQLRQEAFNRVLSADEVTAMEESLRRASYAERPGHPVLLGKKHWEPLIAELAGDVGARLYLDRHGVVDVACNGLGGDRDVDLVAEIPRQPGSGQTPLRQGMDGADQQA